MITDDRLIILLNTSLRGCDLEKKKRTVVDMAERDGLQSSEAGVMGNGI